MTYEDMEFVIRAGLGGNEWTMLIYYPDNVDGPRPVPAAAAAYGKPRGSLLLAHKRGTAERSRRCLSVGRTKRRLG
jgi:hypothetical protein